MSKFKTFIKSSIFKTIAVYLGFTLFCLLFTYVYMLYSHDVYSDYMTYLFAWPLSGGVIAVIGLLIARGKQIRLAFNTYNSGVAILTFGSLFRGILDIAHATSIYEIIFWIVGGIVMAAGIIIFIITLLFFRKK